VIRLVGFFVELDTGPSDVYEGSILDAVGPARTPEEDRLCDYLANGVELIDMMEASLDVISRDKYIAGSSSVLTDGVWAWRHDLSYYVRRYHLRLDHAFLQHVADSGYTVPTISFDRLVEATEELQSRLGGQQLPMPPMPRPWPPS
jgi:hypothetical protein